MKKTLLIIAVAGLAMASCKKDRTCTCTTTYTPVSGPSSTATYEVIVKKAKKNAAKDGMCSSTTSQVTAPTSGTKYETNCELK